MNLLKLGALATLSLALACTSLWAQSKPVNEAYFNRSLRQDGKLAPSYSSKAGQKIALSGGSFIEETAEKTDGSPDAWGEIFIQDATTGKRTNLSTVVRGLPKSKLNIAEVDLNQDGRLDLVLQSEDPNAQGTYPGRVVFIYFRQSEGSYLMPEIFYPKSELTATTYGVRGDGYWFIQGQQLIWDSPSSLSSDIKKGRPNRQVIAWNPKRKTLEIKREPPKTWE